MIVRMINIITFFKELSFLAKSIFNKVDVNKPIEILHMNNFPFAGYSNMMWCGTIITKNKDLKISQETLNHEKGHLIHASHYDRWIQYYLIYVWEWLKGNPFSVPRKSAYFTIPFEVQAYANQHNSDYNYSRSDLIDKYTLKNRKYVYTKHESDWREWVKTI